MKNRLIPITLISFLIALSTFSGSIAAESPTCDEGDIRNASVQIDGIWYLRPESRIDGFPRTSSTGPFPVRATLLSGSTIVSVDLFFSTDGSNFTSVPMTVDGGVILGEIPGLGSFPPGDNVVAFFLNGLDESGHGVWLDEIPYTCSTDPGGYTQGDPYQFVIVGSEFVDVDVDIKPGSDPNSINLKSKGLVPVAILTTEDFDATTVDPITVLFAGANPLRWATEDIDLDGDMDLVFFFRTQELNLDENSTEAMLEGETFSGLVFYGIDTVKIKD